MGMLLFYAFLHAQYGVDLTDTSDNLGNYLGPYTFEEMESDIEKLQEEPVVFVNTSYYPDILSDNSFSLPNGIAW